MARLGPQMHEADKSHLHQPDDHAAGPAAANWTASTPSSATTAALNASALLGLRKPVVWLDLQRDAERARPRRLHAASPPYGLLSHRAVSVEQPLHQSRAEGGQALARLWAVARTPCAARNGCSRPTAWSPDYRRESESLRSPRRLHLPVTFGGKTATVRIRNLPGLGKMKCEALHPGREDASPARSHFHDGMLEITVPLVSGCAMVRMTQ